MSHSVHISVEAPIENQIQEITYDGQEIYQAYVFQQFLNFLILQPVFSFHSGP